MKRQASVQDISWFIDLDSVGRLDLSPPYQRRSVWTINDRRFFLDTIFRNYPCPPIFIHKTINESGVPTYHIVDGKQRLETILNFAKNKIAIDKEFGDERLNGKKFKDLDSDMKKILWNYNVPVDFIEIPQDLDINEVFDRVNRNSRNLERQELRHARYSGWFITECESEADEDPFWEMVKVTSKAKAKRMKNVQFVSELLMILINKEIVGFDQNLLDEVYAQYDTLEEDDESFDLDEFNAKKNFIKEYISEMERTNSCITTYAKTNYNFYSLFALLALDNVEIPASEMAVKYSEFMTKVNAYKLDANEEFNEDDSEQQAAEVAVEPIADVANDDAFKYYLNTRGANTEPPQRIERLKALQSIIG